MSDELVAYRVELSIMSMQMQHADRSLTYTIVHAWSRHLKP